MMRPTRANKPNGYLLGSYRIATAPSRTPGGSRASNRNASIAPRTTSVRGPLAWAAPRLVLIDQSQLRQRQRELHASHEQPLTRLPLELLNGLAQIPAHELRVPIDPVQCSQPSIRRSSRALVSRRSAKSSRSWVSACSCWRSWTLCSSASTRAVMSADVDAGGVTRRRAILTAAKAIIAAIGIEWAKKGRVHVAALV